MDLRKCYIKSPHGQWVVAVIDWMAQQIVSVQPGRGDELERQKLLSSFLRQHKDLSSHFVTQKLTVNE